MKSKELIRSDILSKQEPDELIEVKFAGAQALIKNRKIRSKTVIDSIAGMILSSIICGVLLVLTVNYYSGPVLLLLVPVYCICYLAYNKAIKK